MNFYIDPRLSRKTLDHPRRRPSRVIGVARARLKLPTKYLNMALGFVSESSAFFYVALVYINGHSSKNCTTACTTDCRTGSSHLSFADCVVPGLTVSSLSLVVPHHKNPNEQTLLNQRVDDQPLRNG